MTPTNAFRRISRLVASGIVVSFSFVTMGGGASVAVSNAQNTFQKSLGEGTQGQLPLSPYPPATHKQSGTWPVPGQLRLLSLSEDGDPVWVTEDKKYELMRREIRFFDITDVHEEIKALGKEGGAKKKRPVFTYAEPFCHEAIEPFLQDISVPNMQGHLGNLTSFHNRFYQSATGVAASKWIQETVSQIANIRPELNITITEFKHSFGQSSVIARIEGSAKTTGNIFDDNVDAVTILGAHLDSINMNDPLNGRSPGADDDGTGSVNLLEVLRTLLAGGWTPRTPIEFHWYAAEEGGLMGSKAVATRYQSQGVVVQGMLQLDMTAYTRPGNMERIALIPDFVEPNLSVFLGSIIDQYSTLPWVWSDPCGYGCSDHASWHDAGYPTVFPAETKFGQHNPTIHTELDSTETQGFSWSHSLEYAKIALAFAYELTA